MRVIVVGTVYRCIGQPEIPGAAAYKLSLAEYIPDEFNTILVHYHFTSDMPLDLGRFYLITAEVEGIYYKAATEESGYDDILGVEGKIVAAKQLAIDYDDCDD